MKPIKTLKVSFKNSNGFLLDARLELPSQTPEAFAIFCHCFTCTKQTLTTHRISRLLAEQGIAVLRFDFTGLGQSEGDFANSNFTTMVDDVIAAYEYLNNNHEPPTFLLGHSMGGTAALVAASQLSSIKGIATIASPSRPDHVLHHFGPALKALEQNHPSYFQVAGQAYPINPQFVTDVRSINTEELFKNITQEVLIFSVVNDTIVKPTNAEQINNWMDGNSRIVNLYYADHLLTNKSDALLVADKISKWIKSV